MTTSITRCIAVAALLMTAAPISAGAARSPDIWTGPDGAVHISAVRAATLRYCNTSADNLYPELEYDRIRDYYYKACMAQHGQLE
jgi:hypothetical protein